MTSSSRRCAERQATTEKGEGCKRFMEIAARRTNYVKLALPVCNGLMLMLKK
jgi:hypothetical protein